MNTVHLTELTSKPADGHWWSQMLRSFAARPPDDTPAREEVGAQRVAQRLAAILDDNWTFIRGYRNGAGRIEHILVGPRGVMALASTTLHGRIHCDGVSWRRDKFDLYNNLVERDAPIAPDPAAELLAAAGLLQTALTAQTSIKQVATGLIFTHDAVTMGRVRHERLALVTPLADVRSATLLHAMSGHPDHKTIDGVVDVIRHEHARFMRRSAQSGSKRQSLYLER